MTPKPSRRPPSLPPSLLRSRRLRRKRPLRRRPTRLPTPPPPFPKAYRPAANNVVSIINNFTTPLKVILRDLKVDAGDTNKSAVTISSSAGVKLELEGKMRLTGGSSGNSGISVRKFGMETQNVPGRQADDPGQGGLLSVCHRRLRARSMAVAASGLTSWSWWMQRLLLPAVPVV